MDLFHVDLWHKFAPSDLENGTRPNLLRKINLVSQSRFLLTNHIYDVLKNFSIVSIQRKCLFKIFERLQFSKDGQRHASLQIENCTLKWNSQIMEGAYFCWQDEGRTIFRTCFTVNWVHFFMQHVNKVMHLLPK